VQALKALNFSTFAAGDSYNDLKMILEADEGCLFRAPKTIIESYPHLVLTTTYGELMDRIKEFLTS